MAFDVTSSAVNTALLNNIANLSTSQKVLSGAIFGLTKKFDLIDTDSLKREKKEEIKKADITKDNVGQMTEKIKIEDNHGNMESDVKASLEKISDVLATLHKNIEKAIEAKNGDGVGVGDILKGLISGGDIKEIEQYRNQLILLAETLKVDSDTIKNGLGDIATAVTSASEIIGEASRMVEVNSPIIDHINGQLDAISKLSKVAQSLSASLPELSKLSIDTKANQEVIDALIDINKSMKDISMTGEELKNITNMSKGMLAIADIKATLDTLNGKSTFSFGNLFSGITLFTKKGNEMQSQLSMMINGLVSSVVKSAELFNKNKKKIEYMNEAIAGIREKLDVFNEIGNFAIKASIAIMGIAGSIAILSETANANGVAASVVMMGSIAGFIYLLSKIDTKKIEGVGNDFIKLSAGIGVLALSMMLFKFVDIQDIGMATLGMVMFAGGLAASFYMLKKAGGVNKEGIPMAMLAIAGSVGLLAISIYMFSALVTSPSQILLPITAMLGIAAAVRIATGGGKDGNKMAIAALALSASVGVLAASIYIWKELNITPMDVLVPVGTIIGLSMALALASKVGGDNMTKAAIGVAIASASVGVLAAALYFWKSMDFTPLDVIIPVGAISVLGLAMAAAGALSSNVMKGAIAVAIASASVGVLAFSLKLWNDYGLNSWDAIQTPLLAIGGIALAVAGLGLLGAKSLMGAGALLLAGLGITVMSYGISKFAQLSGEQLLNTGLFLGAISLAVIGLGAAGAMSLMGAGALLLTGLGIMMIGKGVAKFESGSALKMVEIAGGITALAAAVALIGNPITLIPLGLGLAAVTGLGLATLQIAKTIIKIKEANVSEGDIMGITGIIDKFVVGVTTTLSANKTKIDEAKSGIVALQGIGSLMKDMADGIQAMANLTYTDYKVVNGRLVPNSVRQLNDADFARAGEGMGKIITALTAPLAAIGGEQDKVSMFGVSFTNPFAGNKVAKGIEALMGIGGVFLPLVDTIKLFQSNQLDSAYIESFTGNIGLLLGGIGSAFSENSDLDTDQIEDTAEAFGEIAYSLERIGSALNNSSFEKLEQLKVSIEALQSAETHQRLSAIGDVLGNKIRPVLEELKEVLASMADIEVNANIRTDGAGAGNGGNTGRQNTAMMDKMRSMRDQLGEQTIEVLTDIKNGIEELTDAFHTSNTNNSGLEMGY